MANPHEATGPSPTAEHTAAITPEATKMLEGLSHAIALGEGMQVTFEVNPRAGTFATSHTKDGNIKVHVSPKLIERAELEAGLDVLGYGILHELGHVKRRKGQPPLGTESSKDSYFGNIFEDIAINYDNAKRTRFVHDMTKEVYDRVLFPVETRGTAAQRPRHMQFMEGLLVLAMTTNAHANKNAKRMLKKAGLTGLDKDVVAAIEDSLDHDHNGKKFNLLEQLRTHGPKLDLSSPVAKALKAHFDALYEADKQDKQDQADQDQSNQQDSGDSSDSDSNSQDQSGGQEDSDQEFDYSDSAGCGHTHDDEDETDDSSGGGEEGDDENQESSDGAEDFNFDEIAKSIAEEIDEATSDDDDSKSSGDSMSKKQKENLRNALGMDEIDFANYMATRNKYPREIEAITEMFLQLRRERLNEFLAPGREVAARGRRINVLRLVKAVANDTLGDRPDIFKTPSIVERIEHEFDGLDFYMLGDISSSMQGEKAAGTAATGVILQEGLMRASSQVAGEHEPLVRIQVQAFGDSNKTLCPLTDSPSLTDLGRTFSVFNNPYERTYVADSLREVKPQPERLTVVAVISDGQFSDSYHAEQIGQELADRGVLILQLIYGGARVSKLADNAIVLPLNSPRDMPHILLNVVPDLVNAVGRRTHV